MYDNCKTSRIPQAAAARTISVVANVVWRFAANKTDNRTVSTYWNYGKLYESSYYHTCIMHYVTAYELKTGAQMLYHTTGV
jgi:hypothetical protein